jgi:shikimate kinase
MNPQGGDRPGRIFITGFMGSGKSTIGPLLASALGVRFIDLDTVIEEKEGMAIPRIFMEKGEPAFRALERRELLLLSAQNGIVVAAGGGALTDPVSLAIVQRSGVLVYLEVSVDVLVGRLRGISGRPMIAAEDGSLLPDGKLRDRITSLLRSRENAYRMADIIVDAGAQSPAGTVSAIVASLRSLRTTE